MGAHDRGQNGGIQVSDTLLQRHQFDPTQTSALTGLRVVDLSRLVAGNLLTKVLADFGGEVIKVEPPEGDTLRAWRAEGVSTAWKAYSRNKKSVALNFRSEEGIAAIKALIDTADILVESFRPGVLEEMGMAPDDLLARNGKLVIVRISGWGQSGGYKNKPGFGTLIEGYSGFAAANGFEDREPVLPPMFLADSIAGLYGASATMIALHAARATGKGQVIDLSLLDPMIAVLEPQVSNHLLTGKIKKRTGSRSTNTAPRNVYPTRDGKWVSLSSATQGMTRKLFDSIGRPELIDDPRFATNATRLANSAEIDGIIRDFIGQMSQAEALAHFDADGVTVGPIMTAADLPRDSYVAQRESLIEVPDADVGWFAMHGHVPRLSQTPSILSRPAPRLGEHNAELLIPLLGTETFETWNEKGIFRQEPER